MSKKRIFGGFLFVGVLIFLFYMAVYTAELYHARPTDMIGNRPENIAGVVTWANPDDFTFLVVGDVKNGTATFKHLLNVCRGDKPTFAAILGDFVCHADLLEHKQFVAEMKEEKLPFQLFIVPGNHDIDPEGTFHTKEFEEFWGASQYHFTIGKNLFIFLNNAPPHDETGEYLKYLDKTLSSKGAEIQNIFVFMHVPPNGLNTEIQARGVEGSAEFMAMMKRYGVKYVFAGDHHGYVKTVLDGTTYIVTGGGGSRLRGEHGHFHHITRIDVNGEHIEETVVAVEKRAETLELLERNYVAYFMPLIQKRGAIVAGVILCGVIILFVVRSMLFIKVKPIK